MSIKNLNLDEFLFYYNSGDLSLVFTFDITDIVIYGDIIMYDDYVQIMDDDLTRIYFYYDSISINNNYRINVGKEKVDQIIDLLIIWEKSPMLCSWWSDKNDFEFTQVEFKNKLSSDVLFLSGDIFIEFKVEDVSLRDAEFYSNDDTFKEHYLLLKIIIDSDEKDTKGMYFNYFNSIYFKSIITSREIQDIRNIAEFFKFNTSFDLLDLEHVDLEYDDAKILAESLKVNNGLTSLDVGGNNIGDKGTKYLMEALKVNDSLSSLKLGGNRITKKGAKYIGETLKINNSLTSLDLEGNEIGKKGHKYLEEGLKLNNALISLNIDDNGIGEEEKKYLTDPLKINEEFSENQSFKLSDVDFKSRLGGGISGDVYKTKDGYYVYKEFKDVVCVDINAISEISILKILKGRPYIQEIKGSIFTYKGISTSKNGYFMKLYPTTLEDALPSLTKTKMKKIMYQILMGLYYAQEKGIVHGDIKPDNILLDREGNVVITDWGHSLNYDHRYRKSHPKGKLLALGSLQYKSPESYYGDKISYKVDIWSCAVLFYFMLFDEYLFGDFSPEDVFSQMAGMMGTPSEQNWRGVTNYYQYRYLHELNKNIEPNFSKLENKIEDSNFINLLKNMLIMNPHYRYSVVEALNHPFFDNLSCEKFEKIVPMLRFNELNINYKKIYPDRHNIIKLLIGIMNRNLTVKVSHILIALELFDFMTSNMEEIYDVNLTLLSCLYLSGIYTDKHIELATLSIIFDGNNYNERTICRGAYNIFDSIGRNIFFSNYHFIVHYLLNAISRDMNRRNIFKVILRMELYLNRTKYNKHIIAISAILYLYQGPNLRQLLFYLSDLCGLDRYDSEIKVNKILSKI